MHATANLDSGSDSGKVGLTDSPRSVATTSAEAEARAMLEAMDHFKLSWFHIKTVLVAGMGFFCDAYDLFAISLVTKTIGRIYYPDIRYFSPAYCTAEGITDATCGTKYNPNLFVPSAMPTNVDSALKAVALCGTFAGQLLFGYLGDKLGRRPVFGFTLWMMVIFAFLSGFSMGNSPTAVITSLCFFRFFLGMGVGGDYPLSATLMSEYSSKSSRGQFVAAVFAMQGTGILAAAVVTLIISSIFDTYGGNPDYIWRLVLMFGAIPTLLTMYARLNLPETPRYTLFVANNAQQMVQDMNTVVAGKGTQATTEVTTVPSEAAPTRLSLSPTCSPRSAPFKKLTFSDFLRKFGKALFGCASTWFLLDIAFYSQNLFQTDVFTAAGWLPAASTMSASEEASKIARAQALLAICSTIPGYWMTVFTIERLGRFKIQMGGFLLMTLFMAILAGDYTNLQNNHVAAFIALYALTFFFANWGPNATTFVIPAEVFPSKFRSFGHGISAAAGKAGAIIGTFGFAYTNTAWGLRTTVGILAVVNVLGLVCTLFVPETMGKSLEELSNDHHFTFGSAADEPRKEEPLKEEAQV